MAPARPFAQIPADTDAVGRTRRTRGAVAALAVATVVVGARAAGVLEGPGVLLLLACLAVAVPTSSQLSRRILLAGCGALGLFPLVWWFPFAAGTLGRGTWTVALLAGALVGWVLAGDEPRERLRSLVPRVRRVDALPLGLGLGTAVVLAPWLTVRSADAALSMLTRGWDHSAHFGIAEMTRQHGQAVSSLAAAPSGESWAYAHYPQGYHSLAATVMELVAPVPGSPEAELVLYTHAMAVIALVATTVLLSGLCALPGLRARPLLATVLAFGVWSTFVLGPGGRVLSDGFPNFYLACVLLACLPLVVVPVGRIATPLHAAAAGGAVVGVAHNWLLLVALAVPAVLVLFLPLGRSRWRGSRRAWAAMAAIVAATALAGVEAVRLLGGQRLGAVLVVNGGISPTSLRATAVLGAACGLATLILLVRRVRRARGGRAAGSLRTIALGGVVVTGLVVAAAIARLQLGGSGELGYYFWKFVLALQLVLALLLAVELAAMRPLRWTERRTTPVRIATATVLVLVLCQAWGAVGPGWGQLRPAAAPGIAARAELVRSAAEPSQTASLIWSAVDLPAATTWNHLVYLSFPSDGQVHPVSAAQWLYALRGTWTDEGNATAGYLGESEQTTERAIAVARDVLGRDGRAVVVVGPELVDAVRQGVNADGWRDRVTSW